MAPVGGENEKIGGRALAPQNAEPRGNARGSAFVARLPLERKGGVGGSIQFAQASEGSIRSTRLRAMRSNGHKNLLALGGWRRSGPCEAAVEECGESASAWGGLRSPGAERSCEVALARGEKTRH